MPLLSATSLAGPGYIILNTLRGMNIVGLLAVMAAHLVMLVKLSTDTNFFFFDAVSHAIVIIICIFLIVSESGIFRKHFYKNWPLLSSAHGFVPLGLTMLVLGIGILGNLNKPATSEDNLGVAFWRIVIGAGILILIIGVLNIISSFVFRDSEAGVTARQVRAKGAVALPQSKTQTRFNISHPQPAKSFTSATTTSTATGAPARAWPLGDTPLLSDKNTSASPPSTKKPNRLSRFADRFTPRNILPSYHERARSPPPPSSYYSEHGDDAREMTISGPLTVNPQFAHLVPHFATVPRPDSTYHPARAHLKS